MTRIIKNVRIILLFLAAFLLNAHMIIPHDHHSSDSNSYQENRCPVSDNGTNHNRPFPVHCHAFNDFTSEKAISNVILKTLQCLNFENCDSFYISPADPRLFLLRIFNTFYLSVRSGIPELSSLRAPPSIG